MIQFRDVKFVPSANQNSFPAMIAHNPS